MPNNPSPIDIEKFAAIVRTKRKGRGLRAVAEEITRKFGEVSASTLSRIEQGNVPDLDTYMRLCQWLEVSADEFNMRATADRLEDKPTSEILEVHLRADRTLPPEAIDALSQMIRFAYKAAKEDKIPKKGK